MPSLARPETHAKHFSDSVGVDGLDRQQAHARDRAGAAAPPGHTPDPEFTETHRDGRSSTMPKLDAYIPTRCADPDVPFH